MPVDIAFSISSVNLQSALYMQFQEYKIYEAAGILKELFEKKQDDFTGHRFITNENEDYPF